MMALKLLSLGRGASGVRWATILLIEAMLREGVLPVIPAQGSVGRVGRSGAAGAYGGGDDRRGRGGLSTGTVMPGGEALDRAGLTPIVLGPKEGLALINGTQFSTACALAGAVRRWRNAAASVVTGALSTDAIMGSTAPLTAAIHALRGHAGQIEVARAHAGADGRVARSAKATATATPGCRTPIASAASRR